MRRDFPLLTIVRPLPDSAVEGRVACNRAKRRQSAAEIVTLSLNFRPFFWQRRPFVIFFPRELYCRRTRCLDAGRLRIFWYGDLEEEATVLFHAIVFSTL